MYFRMIRQNLIINFYLSQFPSNNHTLAEFDDFLDTSTIAGEEEHYLPECLMLDGLVFALNVVEWSIMWSETKECLRKL